MNLLENLNQEQREAVTHKEGPLLIVAGAGTGKTTVIAQRIAYLVEKGLAKSDEILALTFTEKAAGEMEERVDKLLPMGYLDLWISTFHGFAERVLKDHCLDIGLPGDFKLLNEFEQWALIKKNLDRFNLDYYRPLGNPAKFIHALIKHFSRVKDEDISSAQYLSYAEGLRENLDGMLGGGGNKRNKKQDTITKQITNYKLQINSIRQLADKIPNSKNNNGEANCEITEQEVSRINEVANAYHVYQQLLLENSALDFGDLINYCLKLFRERPGILEQYRKQFKYILLDEFQDTNWAQHELVKMLAAPKNNLVVVGDDDQCLPGGSLILTETGNKRIDKIQAGDKVATAVGKGYLSYGKVNYVDKSRKKARLLTYTTKAGHKITATDNHKMFCFTPSSCYSLKIKRFYYVYLMHKQELGWRMGITNDLSVRLKLERSADRIIAVRAYETEEEARYNELLLSLKYGIPTICFHARGGVMDKKVWSEKLYQDLDVDMNVSKLAADLHIDLSAHQVCLGAVNRGGKIRIKINLEMCVRNYRSKYAKGIFLSNPKVEHLLAVETSHKPTLAALRQLGFYPRKAKKGQRIRIASSDLAYLGRIAEQIRRKTNGFIEHKINIGTANIQYKKALIIPAKNVLPGMFLPIVTKQGVIYDQILTREEKIKELAVYDLEIDRTHNFIANGVAVHNSIYKFRGASVSNILQFKKDYPAARQTVLVNNYRNKQNILDLSYEFIQLNNPNRLEWQLGVLPSFSSGCEALASIKYAAKAAEPGLKAGRITAPSKKLAAQIKGEGEIAVIQGGDLHGEVEAVINKIIELKNNDDEATWNDFAILVRANDSAADFCNGLDKAGLPYVFFSSRGLYAKPVIMDLAAYLKMLDNYHESAALFRVLNLPIFNFSYQELVNFNYWARKKSWSLFEVIKNAAANPAFGTDAREKIKKVLALIDKHTGLARHKSAGEVALAFLTDSGYLKYLTSREEQKSREAISLLNQFMKRIKTFEAASSDKSVKAFLEEFNLEIEAGEEGSLAPDAEAGPEEIKVMTAHAAKGLEFKYVFIANMVDKRFPTIERKEQIAIPDALVKEILPEGDVHLEEERRLFYVAMTRAKEGLYFSWAEDYGGARKKKPSRFLAECGLVKARKKDLINVSDNPNYKLQITNYKQIQSASWRTKSQISKNNINGQLISMPSYFSYTQLAAFSSCPYQYRFAHILKVPIRGKAVFSFGKTMHMVLQKIFLLVNERRESEQGSLFGANNRTDKMIPPTLLAKGGNGTNIVGLKEIMKIYEESWIDDWYENKKQKEEYRKKGREILQGFYEKYRRQGGTGEDNWPRPIFLEKGFNIKLADGQDCYTVRGVIDRIDEAAGGLKIVDYKTGRPKDKLSFEEKEQLLIYQIAACELFEKEIASLAFYYLDNNSEAEFLGSEEELKKVKDKILNIIKEIKKGEFPARPSELCKFCDFKDICEFRKM